MDKERVRRCKICTWMEAQRTTQAENASKMGAGGRGALEQSQLRSDEIDWGGKGTVSVRTGLIRSRPFRSADDETRPPRINAKGN